MCRLYIAILFLASVLGLPSLASAQYSKLQGFCEDGGQPIQVAGITSTTLAQRSYVTGGGVGCTVTVSLTSDSSLATIFSNSTGTPQANPFSAASDGQWFAYGVPGTHVDVQFSGAGITSPFTRGDQIFPFTNNTQLTVPCGNANPGIFYGNSGLKNVTFLAADCNSGIITMQPVGNGMTSSIHAQVTSGTLPTGTLAEFVVTRTSDQSFGGNYSRFSMTSISAVSNPPQGFDGIHIEAGGTETSGGNTNLLKRPFIYSIGVENPPGNFVSYEAMRLLSDADTGSMGFGISVVGVPVRNTVQIYGPQRSTAGVTDGHSLEFFAYSFDTVQHAVNWRFVDHPTSNAGASTFQLQNRVDGAAFVNMLTVDSSGNIVAFGNLTPNVDNTQNLGALTSRLATLYVVNLNSGANQMILTTNGLAGLSISTGGGLAAGNPTGGALATQGSLNMQGALFMNNSGVIDNTGKVSAGGSGTATVVYRCSVAGTLRAGQLTTVMGDCGTAVDSNLRVQ